MPRIQLSAPDVFKEHMQPSFRDRYPSIFRALLAPICEDMIFGYAQTMVPYVQEDQSRKENNTKQVASLQELGLGETWTEVPPPGGAQ